jgi:hypothetical protein
MGRRNQGDKEQAQHLNQSAVVHFLNKNEEATATYFVAVSLHHYQDKRDRDVLYNSDVILCWYQDKEMPELDVGVLSLIADIRWSDIAQDYEV